MTVVLVAITVLIIMIGAAIILLSILFVLASIGLFLYQLQENKEKQNGRKNNK